METMEPATNVGPHNKEHEIYSDRLHGVVTSDAQLKLQRISQHYEDHRQQLEDGRVMALSIQQQRQRRLQNEKRLENIEELRQKHNDIRTLNRATMVQVAKPPPYTTQRHLKRRQQQQQRREQEVQAVQTEIAQFETRKKRIPYGLASLSRGQAPSGCPVGGVGQGFEVPGSGARLTSNSESLQDIRQRLQENAVARQLKEKRQDRFLVEQLKAQEAQEGSQREEQLVRRLTRQTQQEQRLATQLLQIRLQKDEVQKKRLSREQQYRQRRERDFQEALDREAALAQQAQLDCAQETRKELESWSRIAAERAQARVQKHSQTCRGTVEQIVDLATRVAEYRLHTGNLIPEQQMSEWKQLLLCGRPLYEPAERQQPAPLDPEELEKQEKLKDQDSEEYTNMVGEWAWPEEAGESKLPLTNNNILGHVVQRLRSIVHQPVTDPSPPALPHCTIEACVPETGNAADTRHNMSVREDADVDEEELHKRVELVLQRVMSQTLEALAAPPGDGGVVDSRAPDSCPATPADKAQGLTNQAQAEPHSSPDEEKPLSNSITDSAAGQGSTSSVANRDSEGVPPKSSSPCPGSSSWVYVDEPLPPELPEALCSHWDAMGESYVSNLKTAMHQLRSQQSVIQLHLLKAREERDLGRPDLMQQSVSQWQKDFNSIPDDGREDEETKALLRLRLDELRECLWDISDQHKEEEEEERAQLGGWLEEHIAVLVNHHSALMQVELDRFQDTLLLLKVYYLGYGEVLPALRSKLGSIPLLRGMEPCADVMHQDESLQTMRVEGEGVCCSSSTEPADGQDNTNRRLQSQSVQLPHEKLICDCEEALTAITRLVSAEAHQGETHEQQERTDNQEVRDKIHQEYAAALDHEGNVSQARVALVKGHGLVMVQALQSRAAHTSSVLETQSEAQYLSDMKSIDRLVHLAGLHIEAAAQLQHELMMETTVISCEHSLLHLTAPMSSPATEHHGVLLANQDEIPEGQYIYTPELDASTQQHVVYN